MFEEKTILLLGAGASAPFEYPLGATLIERIVKGINSIPSNFEYNYRGPAIDFLKQPYTAIVQYIFSNQSVDLPVEYRSTLQPWKTLANDLQNSSHQSIDDYVRLNPSASSIVKLLITLELASNTFAKDSLANKKLQIDSRFTTNSRKSWYGKLVHKIRENCDSAQMCVNENDLTVLTFNYDRSLDMYLDVELSKGEKFRGLRPSDVAPIFHMHGALDFDPPNAARSFSSNYADSILTIASRLSMVDDDREITDQIAVARSILAASKKIVVFGFEFHKQNVELLDLANPRLTSKMVVLNYMGSRGFKTKLLGLGVYESNIWQRSSGHYEIADAIDDGVFESGS